MIVSFSFVVLFFLCVLYFHLFDSFFFYKIVTRLCFSNHHVTFFDFCVFCDLFSIFGGRQERFAWESSENRRTVSCNENMNKNEISIEITRASLMLIMNK